jgi:hypothetical protein
MGKKRPIGVIIFGILLILIGATGLFGFSDIISKAIFALMFISSIGILFLREWARKITLFVLMPLIYAVIFWMCYEYARAEGTSGWAGLIWFGYSILVSTPITVPLIIYFTRPKVKQRFN